MFFLSHVLVAVVSYRINDMVEDLSVQKCYPDNNDNWDLYNDFGNVNGGNYKVVWVILFDATNHVSQIEAEFTQNLYNQYHENGLAVIGVGSNFNTDSSCEEWGETFGIAYPIIDDSDMYIHSLFTESVGPFHILLDHEMRVIYSEAGTIVPPFGNEFLNLMENGLIELESLIITSHLKDWNMVGISSQMTDATRSLVFTGSEDGTLFYFDETYVNTNEMLEGVGYWLHFPYAGHAAVNGDELNVINISLTAGWNLISGISEETMFDDINDPGQIVVPGSLYEFDGTYLNSAKLLPGRGYWINAFEDGNIIINTEDGTSDKIMISTTDLTEKANILYINNSKLYFGVQPQVKELIYYQLPPKPPAGIFDVRYDTQLKLSGDEGIIEISNDEKVINISVDIRSINNQNFNWVLSTPDGSEFILNETKSIHLDEQYSQLLLNKVLNVPAYYSLSQNFPNPFNPETMLEFVIPHKGYVQLKVFDILGKEVRDLVDRSMDPGFHTVKWEGTDNSGMLVSAGCYFYQIKVTNPQNSDFNSELSFLKTRKMVFFK